MVYKDEELMRELLQAFHVEAPEHVQTLNQALLRIERQVDEQQHQELMQEAFRAAHSLKGAARAVSFTAIEKLAHGIEEVLKQARDAGMVLDPTTCDLLYSAFDVIPQLLSGEPIDIEPLYEKLSTLEAAAPASPPAVLETSAQPASVEAGETIRVAVSKLDLLMAQTSELMTAHMSAEERLADVQDVRKQLNHLPRLWRDLKVVGARASRSNEDSQRLVTMLRLMEDCLSDLTRTVNRLDSAMHRDTLRLGMVSGRLQGEMRQVRMVPFQTLHPLFQRTVRDAARLEGKKVELHFDGGEVELDKKVLEALKDAFLHLLRNAVSHGIETPQVREAHQKSTNGQILVRIVQKGSEAHITIRDDGSGFDLDSLRQSAEARHLALNGDEGEVVNVAFLPGVTTSQQLTELSGRGVGLDVVRRQIENLQGRIVVDNFPGQGAAFQLIVPVSLAMTRVLLVRAGDHRYALPLASVEKIIRPQSTFRVEGQSLLPYENKSIPLVPLARILNVTAPTNKDVLAVIIRVGEQQIALLVDDVLTEQELAVKPLSKPIIRVRHIAGVALLGNGEPVVVLNAADLVKTACALNIQPFENTAAVQDDAQRARHRILVVDDSITTRTLEKNILEAAGYEVYTATDGVRALQQLKTQSIALVVADVEMPNMDGIALTRYLRDSQNYPELPVILVTSLESKEDRERGMSAGANAFIVKRGFNQAELLATIQQLL